MAIDVVLTRFIQQGVPGLVNDYMMLSQAADTYESKASKLDQISNRLLIGGGAGLAAVSAIVGKSLQSAGQMEGISAGLTAMLGSKEAAAEKIKQIQDFAQTTPFDFTQSAAAAQQLLAMGFAADDIIPMLHNVGNAVAASGGGTDAFRGVLLALGQIQTKGKLSQEELNQIAERGIPIFEILRKSLGLTQEQLGQVGKQGISAAEALPKLIKGMGEVGGGNALDEMSNTLPGKISNLGDSVNQLNSEVGKLFSADARGFIGQVGNLVDMVKDFVQTYPGMAKIGIEVIGGVAGIALLGGALGKVEGIINNFSVAKKRLTGATKEDTAAEAAKAIVAGQEGKAIKGVGEEVTETTKKLGILSRVKAFMGSDLAFQGQTMAMMGGKTITKGMGLASVAVGAAAGYGAADDYAAMGDSNAALKGTLTGVSAAVASMFIPGAIVPIALATGFRYVFNELVNVPMEKAATEGNGLTPDQEQSVGTDKNKQSEAYFKLADDKAKQAAEIEGSTMYALGEEATVQRAKDLRTEEETFRRVGISRMRAANKEAAENERAATMADLQQRNQEAARKEAEKQANYFRRTQDPNAPAVQRHDEDNPAGIRSVKTRDMGSTERRDGVTIVKTQFEIPQREADRQGVRRHFRSMTPSAGGA